MELGDLIINGSHRSNHFTLTVYDKITTFTPLLQELKKKTPDIGMSIDGFCEYVLFGHRFHLEGLHFKLEDIKDYDYDELEKSYINEKGTLVEAKMRLSFRDILVKKKMEKLS